LWNHIVVVGVVDDELAADRQGCDNLALVVVDDDEAVTCCACSDFARNNVRTLSAHISPPPLSNLGCIVENMSGPFVNVCKPAEVR
jgi:hypothetical protein